MNKQFAFASLICFAILTSFSGCKKGGLNVFTIEDDKNFGLQMETEIANNPSQYPLLSKTTYASSYAYLENMKQQIIAGGTLDHANDFVWKLYIIQDDNTQNAFCTPGGYIYVYTGLIKYLNNASSLAGVLGHEMAHADKRHSTEQMTKQYGLSLLVGVVGALITWRAAVGALAIKAAGETSMILGWPVWIAQVLMVPGFLLMALAGFYMVGIHLRLSMEHSGLSDRVKA